MGKSKTADSYAEYEYVPHKFSDHIQKQLEANELLKLAEEIGKRIRRLAYVKDKIELIESSDNTKALLFTTKNGWESCTMPIENMYFEEDLKLAKDVLISSLKKRLKLMEKELEEVQKYYNFYPKSSTLTS